MVFAMVVQDFTLLVLVLATHWHPSAGSLRCFDCKNVTSPARCTNVTVCHATEECFVEERVDEGNKHFYNVGCELRSTCDQFTNRHPIGRTVTSFRRSRDRSVSLTKCFRCCRNDDCNDVACEDLCRDNPCQHNGTCTASKSGNDFSCACAPGYTGKRCETDVNECKSFPCQNGGTCVDGVNTFSCDCHAGYEGNLCQNKASTVCSHCQGVNDPKNCAAEMVCPSGQECYTDSFVESGRVYFNLGCRTTHECDFYRNLSQNALPLGRRGHVISTCHQCCATDLCNSDLCRQALGLPGSCLEHRLRGQHSSGLHWIDLQDGEGPLQVLCDMTTDGGGWTVFQHRHDGSVDFNRGWHDYEMGFGNLSTEFWLGNRRLHSLTRPGPTELRVELTDWGGASSVAKYDDFAVSSGQTLYVITVSGYSGTAGDSLSYSNGSAFSTPDADHDSARGSCAVDSRAAWWFRDCTWSSLNGQYGHQGDTGNSFLFWYHWKRYQSLQASQMKLR